LTWRHVAETFCNRCLPWVAELAAVCAFPRTFPHSSFSQLALKVSEQQTSINDLAHKRQEELQSLEKSRQEHDHSEEAERSKLRNKIQVLLIRL